MSSCFYNYKNFIGSIEYSENDNVYYGSIQNIKDCVNYEANSKEELKDSFYKAVDDYLEFCKIVGKSPDIKIEENNK